MRTSEVKNLIKSRFQAGVRRSILLEASPGVGKTQIAAQVATELGVGFRVIHAPLLQPEDYGFPVINAEKTDVAFLVSKSKFPVEGSDTPERGIFLIDELSQADSAAQKILANLLQEREIHGQKLKAGWFIVATGNRQSDKAGANRILSHLGNRLTRISVDVSLDDWSTWAIQNAVAPEVVAFVRFRPELLNSFDPQAETNPTPRAWVEGVAASLGVVSPSQEFEAFKGDVGEGAAAEFCAFLKVFRKLPSPDAILLNPSSAEIPADPSTLYALCGALSRKSTPDNFGRVMEYVGRMPAEFGVLFVRDCIARTPAIQNSQGFIAWAAGKGAAILS